MPEYKKDQFKEDHAKFYGVDPRDSQKLDFNKLYQATKESRGISQPLNIPAEIKNHPDFKKNQKKFFGLEPSDTHSEYNRNAGKFFGATANDGSLQDKFMNIQGNIQVNKESETYKKNAATFFNTDYEIQS